MFSHISTLLVIAEQLRYPSLMLRINIQEAEKTLPSLLAAVEEQGELILICREGKPVAEIRPVLPQETRLRLHPQLSQVKFREDPMLPL